MSAAAPGAFAPFRQRTFAVLWVATVLGNTGTFMRDVASGWLVTDLSTSPTAVSLIQVAGTLPIFLLAIPAGVLSDILDRRRLLVAIQVLLAAVSATLMMLAANGHMTVGTLIALTLVGGIGTALMAPTWQSIVPELVPGNDLRNAVALNSLGVNVSRSIGPALGGFLLAGFGAALTYGVDVASYLLVTAALIWWRRPRNARGELSEHFGGAFRAGLRYARASRPLHRVLARAIVYFAFAGSIWALLPLVARHLLRGDASFYGVLLGGVGVGAVIGALFLPKLRRVLDSDGLLLVAAESNAVGISAFALSPPQWLGILLSVMLGVGWIIALTTLNATVQAILPNWVRGRGLAVYLTVFNGALAAGSLVWGLLAKYVGVPTTLVLSAAGLALTMLVLRPLRLPKTAVDLTPSHLWLEPLVASPVEHDRGPVLVQIHYHIRSEDRGAFLSVLARQSEARRRDGAYAWGVSEDAAQPAHILEWFVVDSWAEHLRQHDRVSRDDADVQREANQFHLGPQAPRIEHYLGLDTRSEST